MSLYSRRRFNLDGNYAPKPPFELNRDSPLSQSLIRWYPFVGTSPQLNGVVRDYSLKPVDGIIEGTVDASVDFDRFGSQALDLTSSSNRVDIGDLLFEVTDECTIAAWVKFTSSAADTTLIGQRQGFFFWLDVGSGVGWAFETKPNNEEVGEAETSGTLNEWQLVCVGTRQKADGNNFMFLDVEGVEIDSRVPTATSIDVTAASASINSENGSNQLRSGNIIVSDVKCWDRLLNPAERYSLWEPSTRWDLTWQPNSRTYLFPSPVTGAFDTFTKRLCMMNFGE